MSDRTSEPERRSSVDRRTFLKRAGAAGAGAVIASRLQAPGSAAAQDATVRPDPPAKRGGTLRYGVHTAPAHFDVHQSGTVANIGAQSPMYDTLLRRSPKDGQTIIPDLAWKWEISPDGKKYTFHLRKGVKFHDGADFTAEDVKATYDRIAHPPKGVVIPRTPLFATVGDIVVVDPHKIEFRLTEPRPKAFMLGAFASGWNIIVRKKTLEENQGNLRQVMAYPGTGPFKHVSRKDKEVWIMERNPDYWNKGLPLGDRLEVHPARRAGEEAGLSEGHQARRAGGASAHEGGGLRSGHQRARFRGARRQHLQALGGRHPGHAQGAPQHRVQPESRADLAVVRRSRWRQLRSGYQRDRLFADGSVRLLQRLVRQGRPAELLVLDEPRLPRPRQHDRSRT